MSKSRQITLLVLVLVGLVLLGQGIGLIEGSFMTGEPIWAAIGSVLIGIALALFTLRRHS
jgi:hypothetical protein